MKKTQLVEIGIIATALVLGYNMITELFSMIYTIAFVLGNDFSQRFGFPILPAILTFMFYLVTFFALIINAKPFSLFICRRNEDMVDIKLSKPAILHVVILIVCLISFLWTIPDIIEYLINKLNPVTDEFSANSRIRATATFPNSLITLIITIIFLITARKMAAFFGKEEPSFEYDGEKIENQ